MEVKNVWRHVTQGDTDSPSLTQPSGRDMDGALTSPRRGRGEAGTLPRSVSSGQVGAWAVRWCELRVPSVSGRHSQYVPVRASGRGRSTCGGDGKRLAWHLGCPCYDYPLPPPGSSRGRWLQGWSCRQTRCSQRQRQDSSHPPW